MEAIDGVMLSIVLATPVDIRQPAHSRHLRARPVEVRCRSGHQRGV